MKFKKDEIVKCSGRSWKVTACYSKGKSGFPEYDLEEVTPNKSTGYCEILPAMPECYIKKAEVEYEFANFLKFKNKHNKII